MTDAKTCPTCGAPLPADATGGACPKCLLQAGFATGTGAATPSADRVPTPEELAPKFPGLEIGALLGRGGMGVVYRARHKALDRDVALKVLPASFAADRNFADRFQREARALAKLQHPNIVAVHDFGCTDGLFWLVMEFVDGANIRQAMRAGQIGPKEALAIVPQICDALQSAHEHGVVHRDIKPENVLLDRTGRVKVADFGLAKLMEHDAAAASLTGAGQVMGTPHYMAPEQWERPKDVDHRADIYSLGVVFYEMLTGELPIGRFSVPSKKSDIDARIDEIVMRTLEKEREARYQRADEVKTDVGRVTAAAGGEKGGAGTHVEATADGVVVRVEKRGEGGSKKVTVGRDGVRVEKDGGKDVHLRWGWDSDAEKARGGRLSKLAVYGALGIPVAIALVVVFAFLTSRAGSFIRAREAGIVLALVIVPAWIASIVAWARIQQSENRLRGRAWAAVGTFLPVVACCLGAPLAYLLTPGLTHRTGHEPDSQPALVRPKDYVAESAHGTPIPIPADDDARICELWERAQELPAAPTLDDVSDLYHDADRNAMRAMLDDRLAAEARDGLLGLPLLIRTQERIDVDLPRFRLTRVRFDITTSSEIVNLPIAPTPSDLSGGGARNAIVTATDGRRVIRFPLSRRRLGPATDNRLSEWFFARGKVEIE